MALFFMFIIFRRFAMLMVQHALRERRVADGVGIYRAARTLWPFDGAFGTDGMPAEDEFLELRASFFAELEEVGSLSLRFVLRICCLLWCFPEKIFFTELEDRVFLCTFLVCTISRFPKRRKGSFWRKIGSRFFLVPHSLQVEQEWKVARQAAYGDASAQNAEDIFDDGIGGDGESSFDENDEDFYYVEKEIDFDFEKYVEKFARKDVLRWLV